MAKIFINPGHAPNGEPDPGASNPISGLRECDVALLIGNDLVPILEASGHEVQILQSDDLEEIVYAANSWGADVFVSIHCNAANEIAKGTEICVFSSNGKRLDCVPNNARRLGEAIQSRIVNSLGTVDRGLKPRTPGINGLYVLTNTNMPAVLVETAFIDQEDDAALLADPEKQQVFSQSIADGLNDYFAEVA